MAFNQIQYRQPEKKEKAPKYDLMEEILKGVQIAGGLAGIYENISGGSEDRALKRRELDIKENKLGVNDSAKPVQVDTVDEGGNPVTGFVIPEAGKTYPKFREDKSKELAKAEEEYNAKKKKTIFDMESSLQAKYNRASDDTLDAYRGFNKVKAAASKGDNATAQDDMALIFGFMKTLDPRSTVREGEQASAEQTAGIPGYVSNLYNKALTGEKLTPQQRREFVNTAAGQMKALLEIQNETDAQYQQQAIGYEVDPERILDKRFGNLYKELQQATVAPNDPTPEEIDAELKRRGAL